MIDRQIVHDILRDYPEARNSDEKVLEKYFDKYAREYMDCFTEVFIRNHYSFIKNHVRHRAYWQNTKWLFPATDRVKEKREAYRKDVVQKIREEKKSFVSNIYTYAKRIIRNK